ncbi:MAG: ubiquinol-cytochrome c reductase iron-sulfur subunit [Maricaulaceae bacterium]
MTDATLDTPLEEPSRRDFIYIATGAFAAVGAGGVAWMVGGQWSPAADTLALASIDVDISQVPEGGEITVKWRGKPVFIRHRTPADIARAEEVPLSALKDPQTDDARLVPGPDGNLKPQYLVMVGVCTHFGCVPLGDGSGDFGGWFCPCHGSHYDGAGRIRKGPAPKNLEVPEYQYLSDTVIRIG